MIIRELLESIQNWCITNSCIEQVMFYGSQALKNNEEELAPDSDIDFIFLIGDEWENTLFEGLVEISKKLNVFIHPLVITKSDYDFKTKIPEYKNALEKSIIIYDRKKKV